MRLATLDRKLLRDLKRLKAQAIAVSAVLACGVALFVMATGMYDSLERARDNYYDSARMADVAVSVVRAPDPVANELAELPGVNALEARVSGIGLLDLAGKSDPVSARLVSLPPDRQPRVNDVLLRAGRWPDPTRDNEVLINEAFAEANLLAPGAAAARADLRPLSRARNRRHRQQSGVRVRGGARCDAAGAGALRRRLDGARSAGSRVRRGRRVQRRRVPPRARCGHARHDLRHR